MKQINIIDLIDHIESHGKDYEYYTIYFKDGTQYEQTEQEFVFMDKKLNGELALKVIN